MAMIPEDEIERIKRGTDLAAVIRARGVELKPSGGDLVGRCPFHDDHDPSLRVTPAKGLWRCMSSACGATGNVIQFVQKFDGVSFRHAFELLKAALGAGGAALPAPPPTGAPLKKSTVPKLASPLASSADDLALMRQVVDYYQARLKENPAALAYLQKRGIANEEALARFKVGFVDRTLGLRLPNNQRKEGTALRARLTAMGIIRKTGHEHMRGRIVFPVPAFTPGAPEDWTVIGTIYGRAVGEVEKHERHLFLPGPIRGIWNAAALASPSVIITEGIIDAFTFWCAGFHNVTTAYSAKTLPHELLEVLLAAKTRQVLLAFDRDNSGDDGTAASAAQLAAHGIECLRVMFPPGHDANSYALSVTPPEKSLGLLLRTAQPIGEVRSKPAVSSSHDTRAPSSLAASGSAAEAAEPRSEHRVASSEHAPITPNEASALQPSVPSAFAPQAHKAARKETAVETTTAPAPIAGTSANEATPPASPAAPSGAAVTITKNEPDETVLVVGDREYRVRGLAKNAGIESLKITLRLMCAERWHLDNLDLCLARERERFITAAASETALKPDLIKRDLGRVLFALEQLQEQRLRAARAPQKPAAPDMPAPLRERALSLLRDPKLLDRILEAFSACGVVGEEVNKLVGYLAATSRLMERPLAVIIQSTSAAGKTALMDAILAFFPPEARVKYSAMTGQALYYLGDADLRHKILAIVEEEGAEKASYALKLLQSEGELSIASTGKDPHTGRMVTQEYRVEGPVMIFLTTTAVDLDEELLNRCLVLTVDESREQTRRIHAQQRARYTLEGIAAATTKSDVLALHRAAQSLLKPYEVHIPWAQQLTFLDEKTRTRRDHNKYLQLIAAVALLHQHQREIRPVACADGRTVPCVVATLDDLTIANKLAHETLGRCLDEMPPQTRRLLGLLWEMAREVAARTKTDVDEVWFTRRQVRERTGWSNTQLKVHLDRLADLEYLVLRRADHGQSFVYELLYDGGGQDGRRFLCGLFDVEKLRAAETTTADLTGQKAEVSGQKRPENGPVSGEKRPEENRASSSENPAPDTKTGENTVPGDGAKDAAA